LFRARHRIAAIAFSGLLGAVACGSPPELTTDDDAGDAADGSSDSSGDGAIGDDDDAGSGGNPDPGGGPGVCGNGKLEMGELCDDGNEADADGCSGNCLVQDPEYDCSTPANPA
jgi:cysteine-rich repeat protein